MNRQGGLEWALTFGGKKDELGSDIIVDPTDQGVIFVMTYTSLTFTVGADKIAFEVRRRSWQ